MAQPLQLEFTQLYFSHHTSSSPMQPDRDQPCKFRYLLYHSIHRNSIIVVNKYLELKNSWGALELELAGDISKLSQSQKLGR